MSLATRCPNCNTVFQVNEEQLKRYSGVVRCGVCHNPFNGIDNLIGRLSQNEPDFATSKKETVTPVVTTPTIPAQPVQIIPENRNEAVNEEIPSLDQDSSFEEISEDNESKVPNEPARTHESVLMESFEKQIKSISLDLNLPSPDDNKASPPSLSPDHSVNVQAAGKPAEFPATHADTERKEPFLSAEATINDNSPDILQNTQGDVVGGSAATEELVKIIQKKKKRSRFSQLLWSIGTLLLLVLLGLQGIYQYSEEITAWWPPAEELVNTTCELLSCPVRTPVNKPVLSVETGAPEKSEIAPDQYIQNVTITNHSSEWQTWPALALELADSDNNVLLRRTFQPEEYLPTEARTLKGLAPESNIVFKMTFEFAHHSAVKSRVFLLDNP